MYVNATSTVWCQFSTHLVKKLEEGVTGGSKGNWMLKSNGYNVV